MEVGQSLFLRIFDDDATYHRWQNYYVGRIVSWDSKPWVYQSFIADGITAGDVSSESSLIVGIPANKVTTSAVKRALLKGYLMELRQYDFDPATNDDGPPVNQRLIASYLGEVVGAGGGLTFIEVELGSALAPVGVQIPPRTFTSKLIGMPCQL